MNVLSELAIVAIGRNEGQRLVRCLKSALAEAAVVVYVDSGSTDTSVDKARCLGALVVDLDLSIPFTAARARNAGFQRLKEEHPEIRFIQFVDGDCEIQPGWLERGVTFLQENDRVAAVAGRRRELFPERSVYNYLTDLEWEVAAGPCEYFGGDVLIRMKALERVRGYREDLIAGEEPELSLRLRRDGWNLFILDAEMTLHDADMHNFRQWWRRMKRSGYAYAQGAHLHGRESERHWVWQTAQAWIWVPLPLLLCLAACWSIGPLGLLVLLIYPLQVLRLYLKLPAPFKRKALQAISLTLVRFPEFSGQIEYLKNMLQGRAGRIIEYK